jgi:small-conductance mechanosensitive channel
MKKQRSPQEIAALAAARRRSLLFILAAVVIGLAMLMLSSEFVALHCVVLAALTLAAAVSCATVAIPILAPAAQRAGMHGGMATALAYAAPFMLFFAYRFITLDDATAARLAGDLSAAQATTLMQQGIMPGSDYFRAQYVSYVFGYLLFALVFGMLLGALGGILARRTVR